MSELSHRHGNTLAFFRGPISALPFPSFNRPGSLRAALSWGRVLSQHIGDPKTRTCHLSSGAILARSGGVG
jgi:hypothetical protein